MRMNRWCLERPAPARKMQARVSAGTRRAAAVRCSVPVVATPQPLEETAAGSRVLVTGGAGFIGSHVVDALLAAGHRPRIVDLRRSEHHGPDSVEEVRFDLGNFKALERAMAGCDA